MDIVYARGQATAAEVTAALPDPPSYSAVRALLRILEQKGHLRHQQDGPRYVFLPDVSRDRARRSALRNLVRTFFDGSSAQAAAALIDQAQLSEDDFERLADAIDKAQEGRAVTIELALRTGAHSRHGLGGHALPAASDGGHASPRVACGGHRRAGCATARTADTKIRGHLSATSRAGGSDKRCCQHAGSTVRGKPSA